MTATVNPVNTAPSSGLEQLNRTHGKTLEAEKKRLRQATGEFESFFTYQMLKTMRQTVPKTDLNEGGSFSSDLGKETWTDMFDMEVARSIGQSNGRSVADVLFRSLEKLIEAEYGTDQKGGIKPLKETRGSVPVRPEPLKLPEKNGPVELKPKPLFETNRTSVRPDVKVDPIVARYGKIIDDASRETALDSALIASVIEAESAGNRSAVSSAGAKGLMQLIDSTATDYGVTDPFDPRQNVMAGSRFLKRMMERYGDLKLALAAYNAGPGNVDKYQGVPPFAETEEYIQRVTQNLSRRNAK